MPLNCDAMEKVIMKWLVNLKSACSNWGDCKKKSEKNTVFKNHPLCYSNNQMHAWYEREVTLHNKELQNTWEKTRNTNHKWKLQIQSYGAYLLINLP